MLVLGCARHHTTVDARSDDPVRAPPPTRSSQPHTTTPHTARHERARTRPRHSARAFSSCRRIAAAHRTTGPSGHHHPPPRSLGGGTHGTRVLMSARATIGRPLGLPRVARQQATSMSTTCPSRRTRTHLDQLAVVAEVAPAARAAVVRPGRAVPHVGQDVIQRLARQKKYRARLHDLTVSLAVYCILYCIYYP